MEFRFVVAQNLRQKAKETGKDQVALARHLRISKQAVNEWFLGTSTPSSLRLKQAAEFYDTTMDALTEE